MIALRLFRKCDFELMRSWAPTPEDVFLFSGSEKNWPLSDRLLESWASSISRRAWTCVIEAESAAIGHIEVVTVGPGHGQLARVLLAPERRGSGLGRAMVSAAIDDAVRSGMRTLDLNVIDGNQAALATYRGLGFTSLGPNPDHPGMTRMRLVLETGAPCRPEGATPSL